MATFDKRRGRILRVDDQNWKWRTGPSGSVLMYSELGERIVTHAHVVTGVAVETWERGQWKRNSDGAITPGDVAEFIRHRGSPPRNPTACQCHWHTKGASK